MKKFKRELKELKDSTPNPPLDRNDDDDDDDDREKSNRWRKRMSEESDRQKFFERFAEPGDEFNEEWLEKFEESVIEQGEVRGVAFMGQ